MSNLVFSNSSNNSNRCIGWSSSPPALAPTITSLSGYLSIYQYTNIITIFGTNFRSYSVVKFGPFTPTTLFLNSNQISFYVPTSAPAGTFPIQVFNDSYGSNIVMFDITSISGPTGATGPIGPTGATGPIGPTGFPGGFSSIFETNSIPIETYSTNKHQLFHTINQGQWHYNGYIIIQTTNEISPFVVSFYCHTIADPTFTLLQSFTFSLSPNIYYNLPLSFTYSSTDELTNLYIMVPSDTLSQTFQYTTNYIKLV